MEYSPVVITEPAAVAALKKIYCENGPGNLDWDFSTPGQVTARDGRLVARDGALIGLNLNRAGLKGVLKLRGLETLILLKIHGLDLAGVDLEELPGLRELVLWGNQRHDLASRAGLKELKTCLVEVPSSARVLKWYRSSAEEGRSESQLCLGNA